MSSSTTQNKKQIEVQENNFQRELQKKIRNKQKKLEKINELAAKIKSGSMTANSEQLEKIASKDSIEAEIAEVKTYLDIYNATLVEQADSDKKVAKQHQREVINAKKSAVTAIANMITMHTILESG